MSTSGVMPKQAMHVGNTCICRSLQQAARVIGRLFDDALRPLEMTNWQFSLLMNVAAYESPSIGELAESLGTDRTTITANLKPLERRGLIEIHKDESDARTRRVLMTKLGAQTTKSAYEIWVGVNATAVEKLNGLNVARIREGLLALSS